MTPLQPEPAAVKPPRRANVGLWVVVTLIALFLIAAGVALALMAPTIARFRANRAGRLCMRRLSQLSSAMAMYSAQNDDVMPVAGTWMDQLRPLLRSERVLHCPEAWRVSPGAYGYAMNGSLSKKERSTIPDVDRVPEVFDSDLMGRNASAFPVVLPARPRHPRGNVVVSVGGRVRVIRGPAPPVPKR